MTTRVTDPTAGLGKGQLLLEPGGLEAEWDV